jgi:arylsulfatase
MLGVNLVSAMLGLNLVVVAMSAKQPNILFMMADDLNADWKNDRLGYMPHLKKYFKDEGTFFENHVAAVPVCGPSRSSFLLGRFPHNGGYRMNGDLDSIANYLKQANDTLGTWLTNAGYHTAFLGKYVNNLENTVAHGWSHWGGFVSTYDFYNASVHDMDWADPADPDPPTVVTHMTGIHQADFLGNLVSGLQVQ